jgi:DNA-binding NtrC family response regulator
LVATAIEKQKTDHFKVVQTPYSAFCRQFDGLQPINHKVSSQRDRPNHTPSIRTTHSMTLTPHPLIGQSEAMRSTRALIQTLAPSLSSVLIHGESGTGKELIAQALHAQGPRKAGPFVPINCGANPRELLESELFGDRKSTRLNSSHIDRK